MKLEIHYMAHLSLCHVGFIGKKKKVKEIEVMGSF